MDYIKGKHTKHIIKKETTRSIQLLGLIHTNIYGLFHVPYFGYVYFLHEKSQSVDTLEEFINDVERQLDKKVKIIKSNKGSEYYGKHDETRQCLGPFAKFLEKCGICAQYTMPGALQHNGIVERLNCTLIDMVWSMLSYSSLSLSLWMYALKTTMYLLSKVSSKVVSKTPFELWIGKRPSLRHLHI